jgi:hypothetical protein
VEFEKSRKQRHSSRENFKQASEVSDITKAPSNKRGHQYASEREIRQTIVFVWTYIYRPASSTFSSSDTAMEDDNFVLSDKDAGTVEPPYPAKDRK